MPATNFIVVEGTDDRHVILHIAQAHDLKYKRDFEFTEDIEGVDQLLRSLSTLIWDKSDSRFAIVIDADFDIKARWTAVRNRLRSCGYEPPSEIGPEGALFEGSNLPCVGVWLMPDNGSPGMLEHFLGQMVPEEDRLWDQAQAVVDSLTDRRFPESQEFKAKIHTWLAWQREPGRPYGVAVRSGLFDAKSASADAFIAWLKRVFDLP